MELSQDYLDMISFVESQNPDDSVDEQLMLSKIGKTWKCEKYFDELS